LLDRGDTPRIFDLSASPYHSPLEVETFTGSITDSANLDLAMRDCDAVIHLAAVADVGHVLADPVLAEEVNTRGTLQVLEAACRAKVGRVVYGSTTWAYSDCPEQEVDEETAIPAPRHLYTATKLAGETYCAGYAELYELESTVLRFGIPYGPRARAAGVVAKFTDLAFEGKALTIAGDGSQTRSFIYVEDLADGIVAALAPEAAGRTYNLSGDEVVTILEIAERVQENTDNCEIVSKLPELISTATTALPIGYCDMNSLFLTQVKGLGSYTIPKVDIQLGGSFQSNPGPIVQATFNAPTALAVQSLGRPLSGNAANAQVNLLRSNALAATPATASAGALYGDRVNQVDLRIGKILRFAQRRTALNLDVYNVLNSSAVLTESTAYGTFRVPQIVMVGRFVKVSAQVDF